MVALTFDEILKDIETKGVQDTRTKEAMVWMGDYMRQFGGKTRDKRKTELLGSNLMKNEKDLLTETFKMGRMYMYYYDPKLKDELPYFDRFPCVFPFPSKVKSKSGETRWLGLNLHYLHPGAGAELMDALAKYENTTRFPERKKLEINYQILKGASDLEYFKPCLKQYLSSHVRSRFLEIPYDAWPIAMMLPLAQFEKKSSPFIWNESYRKV